MKTRSLHGYIDILLAGMTLVAASGFSPATAAIPTDAAEMAAKDFKAALEHADEAGIKKMLTPEFEYISGSGKVFGVEKLIALYADPQTHFDPFVDSDQRIRSLTPDSVVVTAARAVSAIDSDGHKSSTFRYLEILTRRNGLWRVALLEVSFLPKSPPVAQ
jgi:Domain of unknown function (DUF4440)